MPALKRRAIVAPEPRPPHPGRARGYVQPALRPSLRNYREDAGTTAESETDVAETDVEVGTCLSALDDQLDNHDSDTDVESSLVLDEKRVQNLKGKGVDPREYGASYRKPVSERPPIRRGLERRRPGRSRRAPRGRVVSTESINAITKCINGLATSASDSDDERLVSSSLAEIAGPPTSPYYPPRSPSPAPPSSDSDGYEPESPLAGKSSDASMARRRLLLSKRKARRQQNMPRHWEVYDKKATLDELSVLAAREGYKLVPQSPKSDASVSTVLFPDEPGPSYPFTMPTTGTTISPIAEKRSASSALGPAWEEDVLLATASEDEVDPLSPVPSPRKRIRSQSVTTPRSQIRRRTTHLSSPQRTPCRDTSNLHRTSPTSLLPRRVKKVRVSFSSRLARKKDAQERRLQLGAFGWGQYIHRERPVTGAADLAALRAAKINHRIRAGFLRQYALRQAYNDLRVYQRNAPVPATLHQRRVSSYDDEAVEALLPDDVEMRDGDIVDAVLSDGPPAQIVGQKRNAQWCTDATRLGASSRHAETISRYLANRKVYDIARAKLLAVKVAEKRERRAALTKDILAAQAAQLAAESAAAERAAAEAASEEVEAAEAVETLVAEPRAQSMFPQVQVARETQARERRERVTRRRAADRIEVSEPHPSRRLIERHRRRPARSTRAVSAQPLVRVEPAERAEREPEQEEPAATQQEPISSPPASLPTPLPTSPLRRAVSVDNLRAPVTPPPSTPVDEPPEYEYPFFPVVQLSSPVSPTPVRPRRHTTSHLQQTPPRYAVNTYSRRSPSPPPPYNAQGAADTQTLMPAVFLPEQQREAWPRVAHVPGRYDEVEHVVFEDTPPEPVRRWFEEGEEDEEETQVETTERGALGTIGRWLGLW